MVSTSPTSTNLIRPVPDLRVELRRASWMDDVLLLEGWISSGQLNDGSLPGKVRVAFLDISTGNLSSTGTAVVSMQRVGMPQAGSKKPVLMAFTAEVDTSRILGGRRSAGKFQVVVQATLGEAMQTAPFSQRYGWGSAGALVSEWSGHFLFFPSWEDEAGLMLHVSRPTMVTVGMPGVLDGEVSIPFIARKGFNPVSVEWSGERGSPGAVLELKPVDADGLGTVVVRGIDDESTKKGRWSITLRDASGRGRLLHWGRHASRGLQQALGGNLVLERGQRSVLRLFGGRASVFARAVRLGSDERLSLDIDVLHGSGLQVTAVELRGARARLQSTLGDNGTFTFPLEVSTWRGQVCAPPPNGYRAWAILSNGEQVRVQPDCALTNDLYRTLKANTCSLRIERDPQGQLYFDVSSPLRDDEVGMDNRRRLARKYTGTDARPHRGVFLESWYGKTFSDNPAALVGALGRAGVPGPYYAAVADRSVEVPNSVVPVLVGSREYWKAMGEAQYVVFNTWFPSEFVRAPDQLLVQTWHGTPLKTLGADTPGRVGREKAAKRLAAGSKEWDLLVSQNAFATNILRNAYRYSGPVIESGYPRNDVLSSPNGASVRRQVRERLGIPQTARVVLYAPTWREDAKGSIGPLDVGALRSRLDEDVMILARGHSVALRRGTDIAHHGVVDVTSYPEPADLMLASDCLLTDYSSVMFDYSVLGRPMIFYVPDYEEYTKGERGIYFDLRSIAPGDVVETEDALVDAISRALDDSWGQDEKYKQWRSRFCAHDDGRAAERVVSAMLKLKPRR